MWRAASLEKTLFLGKTEGRRRRGWQRVMADSWMASPTWWTWVWASSGIWCWTRKTGSLQSMGLQRVGHDWETEWPLIVFWPLSQRSDLYLNSLMALLIKANVLKYTKVAFIMCWWRTHIMTKWYYKCKKILSEFLKINHRYVHLKNIGEIYFLFTLLIMLGLACGCKDSARPLPSTSIWSPWT